MRDATRDEQTIADLFRGTPNIGIATGVNASRVVVLDIDPRNGGHDSLARLERELGPLPATVSVATGGGGRHLYFRAPKLRLMGRLDDGIDVKADGGLVVAPPSLHASGRRYRWEPGRRPDEIKIARLPPNWLASLIAVDPSGPTPPTAPPEAQFVPISERVRRARAYASKLPPAISGAGGHRAAFIAACKIAVGFLLDEDAAFMVLWEAWNPTCDPPWSRAELRRKVREAVKHGRFGWGALLLPALERMRPRP